jgi:hypothetical protein
VGVIVVAIVGNAAEHWVAIYFASRDKMDLSVNIALGSAAQIALFAAPVLMLLSLLVGDFPMAFVFNGFEVGAVVRAVLIAPRRLPPSARGPGRHLDPRPRAALAGGHGAARRLRSGRKTARAEWRHPDSRVGRNVRPTETAWSAVRVPYVAETRWTQVSVSRPRPDEAG